MSRKGKGHISWSMNSFIFPSEWKTETEQWTVLWDMSFFFSSETRIDGTIHYPRNWSINSLTPRALHDFMMWNTYSESHETMIEQKVFLSYWSTLGIQVQLSGSVFISVYILHVLAMFLQFWAPWQNCSGSSYRVLLSPGNIFKITNLDQNEVYLYIFFSRKMTFTVLWFKPSGSSVQHRCLLPAPSVGWRDKNSLLRQKR